MFDFEQHPELFPALVSAFAALLSVIAAGLAAWATWKGPSNAAVLAERLRCQSAEKEQRRQMKRWVFTTLMQERCLYNAPDAVKAFNLIDVVFIESFPVREAWAKFHETLDPNKKATELEVRNRHRELLSAIAKDLELSEQLSITDLERLYYPTSMEEERLAQTLYRQNLLRRMAGQGASAANTAAVMSTWPPRPGEATPPEVVVSAAKARW